MADSNVICKVRQQKIHTHKNLTSTTTKIACKQAFSVTSLEVAKFLTIRNLHKSWEVFSPNISHSHSSITEKNIQKKPHLLKLDIMIWMLMFQVWPRCSQRSQHGCHRETPPRQGTLAMCSDHISISLGEEGREGVDFHFGFGSALPWRVLLCNILDSTCQVNGAWHSYVMTKYLSVTDQPEPEVSGAWHRYVMTNYLSVTDQPEPEVSGAWYSYVMTNYLSVTDQPEPEVNGAWYS